MNKWKKLKNSKKKKNLARFFGFFVFFIEISYFNFILKDLLINNFFKFF